MSRWTTKNKPAAAIHATKISWTLTHAFFASASVPGFAPSRPANRSWTSVPVVRGGRNRQEADRTTQPTNPQTIADRRRLDVRSCSRVRPAYAAAKRATPGKSALNATHPKMPAVNGPSGPRRFRATAKIQMRFVASRRTDAHQSRVAESPSNRRKRPRYSKPVSRPGDSGLAPNSKGFLPRGGMLCLFGISRVDRRTAVEIVRVAKSPLARTKPPADCFAGRRTADQAGSLDWIEIVIVRHEGRRQVQTSCGVHAILCTLRAEIERACADEAFLDVNDL